MGLLAALLGVSEDELAKIRALIKRFDELEDKQRDQKRKLDDVDDAVRRRLDRDTSTAYNDVLREALARIDKEQLVADATEKIQELLEKEVLKAAKEVVKDRDLANRIWEAIDEDDFRDALVEAFTSGDEFGAWLKENMPAIAAEIAASIDENDKIDWDELNSAIGKEIAQRLEWKEPKE